MMTVLIRNRTSKGNPGQAATEYLILLFFVVFIFLMISRFLSPLVTQMAQQIKTTFLQTFTQAQMYQLPPGLRH